MTIFTDSATLSTVTAISATEIHPSVESATISTKTSISVTEIKSNLESSTISTSTYITSVDAGPYYDSDTPQSVTTPDVILEVPTTIHIDISLSGSAIAGEILTATISITVSGDTTAGGGGGTIITDPDAPGYSNTYSPSGQWGSSDDDDGVIV